MVRKADRLRLPDRPGRRVTVILFREPQFPGHGPQDRGVLRGVSRGRKAIGTAPSQRWGAHLCVEGPASGDGRSRGHGARGGRRNVLRIRSSAQLSAAGAIRSLGTYRCFPIMRACSDRITSPFIVEARNEPCFYSCPGGLFVLAPLLRRLGVIFRPGEWYEGLAKPSWRPPNWLFAPVWTILYISIAVSGWMVWRMSGLAGAAVPLAIFAVQLALNAAWTPIFSACTGLTWPFTKSLFFGFQSRPPSRCFSH